jgi:hypothetical protein
MSRELPNGRRESGDAGARRGAASVRLFVRIGPEVGVESRKEWAIERFVSLDERGAVADYDVLTWGKEIRPEGPLSETPYCRRLLEHIDDLQEWIDDNGVVNCGFDARDVTSTVTDEAYDVIELPAVYDDGDL